MPEDRKKDMYDALIKSHHEMISKMYEDALKPVLSEMNKNDLKTYVGKIERAIQSVRKIIDTGDKR